MRVTAYAVGALATNCYLVAEEGRCVLIDPGDDAVSLFEALRGDRLKLLAILLTHAHFDHTGAAAALQQKTGAPAFVGSGDGALLSDPGWMKDLMQGASAPSDVRTLRSGDEVKIGSTVLTVFETPGHSPGSLCFYGAGRLFSGDLVFKGSVGRTDLPGGDEAKLYDSIRLIAGLPDDTIIHPGHGPSTTVGHERVSNPYWRERNAQGAARDL